MLQALSLFMYVWVLICIEDAYHTNTRRHRQEEGSSPIDSRGSPHRFKRWPPLRVWCGTLLHVALFSKGWFRRYPHRFERWPPSCVWCGALLCVALCSVWGMDSRGGLHGFRGGPRSCVWCGTLLRMAVSFIQDPLDASTIVEYILVIPTPGMLCRTPVWLCY